MTSSSPRSGPGECCATSPPPTAPSASMRSSGSDDPVEADATLALRETATRAALGFYLDHDRVHTGDLVGPASTPSSRPGAPTGPPAATA